MGRADVAYPWVATRAAAERNQADKSSGLESLVVPLERYVHVEKGVPSPTYHCYSLCLKQLA